VNYPKLFEAAAQVTTEVKKASLSSEIAAIPHICYQKTLPGSPAQYAEIPDSLGDIKQALQRTGIDKFYRHQAESYAALVEEKNVLLDPYRIRQNPCFCPLGYQFKVGQHILSSPQSALFQVFKCS
jgi:hypothetical protein